MTTAFPFIGVGDGANPGFLFTENGAVRRLTGNAELAYLRDEKGIEVQTIKANDVKRAAAASKALFGI